MTERLASYRPLETLLRRTSPSQVTSACGFSPQKECFLLEIVHIMEYRTNEGLHGEGESRVKTILFNVFMANI